MAAVLSSTASIPGGATANLNGLVHPSAFGKPAANGKARNQATVYGVQGSTGSNSNQVFQHSTASDASKRETTNVDDVAPTYYLECSHFLAINTLTFPAVVHDEEDSDDEIQFAEIPVEEFEDLSESDGEETLEKAVQSLNERTFLS
ncbi:hypothetical protein HDU96_010133, partial [Phlyctochytrium bullatum]